ncbi:P-loop containing nucleoside triphosphate hydrolase protein [Thelephora terrestris]|uniref:P-loop containing nucleoside triphosphate hydrolase protein n=1 Tax=Thelephora terrestris TaxID=56493 RepID=A0A9P6H6S9_9AGAM|nr:P-loop containing nucleoside triphosphate hydrolase protein [Thelephora terrestris]
MDQPIKIAVMGATGCGKTSFINLASRSNLQVGAALESCTPDVQLANEFTLDGRRVVLIDTPGFDDTTKSDTDILKKIGSFLATSYESGSRLAGLLYVHRISDKRFGGIAGRNFKIFRDLCGEKSLKNVVLVTNMWGEVSLEVGEDREKELSSKFLKPALDKGAQMIRHHNNERSAHDIIRRIMNNHPVVLRIQQELVDEHKDITNTSAAETINAELEEAKRRHDAEVKKAQEEMARALREKEEQTRRRIEEETRKREEEMRRVREERERVELQRRQEMERVEQEARRLAEQARIERQRAEEEHRRQVALLNERLAAEAAAAEAARRAEQERIDHLQHQIHHHHHHHDNGGGCVIM